MIFRGPVRPFILLAILVISLVVLLTPWGMEAGQRTKKVLLDATISKSGGVIESDTITYVLLFSPPRCACGLVVGGWKSFC